MRVAAICLLSLLLLTGIGAIKSVAEEGDNTSRAEIFLKSSGVSDEVIKRLRDAHALSLPVDPSPEYRAFIEEWLYISDPENKFPDLAAFRAKIAERIAAIERDPKPAFEGWNTMDQPLVQLQDANIVYRGKWSQGADYENGVRKFWEKYHPGESPWEMRRGSASVRSETYALVLQNLQEGVRRFAREADLMAAAAEAHNAIVKAEVTKALRRIGEIIGAWERTRNVARARQQLSENPGLRGPSAFDDLVGQINALTKYTVYPHSSQVWSFSHHRPFSGLNPDETADGYRRKLARQYVERIKYVAAWPEPDWSDVHKCLVMLQMEFAGLYSVSDVEGPIKAALRRSFSEATRTADVEAMVKVYSLQEVMGLSEISFKELQTELTTIALKEYEAAVDREDIPGMMKAYAFGQTGLTDPARMPPLGNDPNLDRIFLKSYRAAIDRQDADGIIRALAFSQCGLVSPKAGLKIPDAKLTEMVKTWYASTKNGRDAAGLVRVYGFVDRGFAEPFVSAEGFARDLAAISGTDGAVSELDRAASQPHYALEHLKEEIETAKSDGVAAEREVDEMMQNAQENAPSGISDAITEMTERERTFDEDLEFNDRVMNQVKPLMDQLPGAVAAHGAAAYANGYEPSQKYYAEQRRKEAEEQARRTITNQTQIVARIDAPAAVARAVRAATTQAKAAVSAMKPAANPFHSDASGGLRAADIRLPAWKTSPDFSTVRAALSTGNTAGGAGSAGRGTSGGGGGNLEINEVKDILQRLFAAYEHENSDEFRNALADNFSGSDLSNHSYDASRFIQAMQDDFRNLDRINFSVNITRPVQYLPDIDRVRAEFTWRRRAYLERSGQEWTLDGRNSTLIFSRSSPSPSLFPGQGPGPGRSPGSSYRAMKLVSIEGDPIFGIAEPSGIIILRDGRLDGARITSPIVLSGGETRSTNPSAIAPTASATATPSSGSAPLTVNFSGSGRDQDGVIVSTSWDFGDASAPSSDRNTSHTYTANGTYTATLTVTDNDGATGQSSLTITVSSLPNRSPTVSSSANVLSGIETLAVNFTSTSSDPDGRIVSTAWDFGDGQISSAQNPSHTYSAVGFYTARVTVTDDSGATASATLSITVAANQPPVPGIMASPTSGVAPLTVNFTSTSSDPDGTIVSFLWDFGDSATSTLANPVYTYTVAGTFNAYLTVRDNNGAVRTTTQPISVTSTDIRVSGSIAANTTWSGNVFVDGDVTVPFGITLTVSPGTTVTFTGNFSITVFGTFNASSATFQGSTATRGFWKGINAGLGSNISITGSTIRHSGNSSGFGAIGDFGVGLSLTYDNNTMEECDLGLQLASTRTLTGNTFRNSNRGVSISGGSPTLSGTVISSIAGNGISMTGGNLTLTGGSISGSTNRGLNVVIASGTVDVSGVTFSNNAGHIFESLVGSPTLFTITGCQFNSASGFSTGVDLSQLTSTPTITGNRFEGIFNFYALSVSAGLVQSNQFLNITSGGQYLIRAGTATIDRNTMTSISVGQGLIQMFGSGIISNNNLLGANNIGDVININGGSPIIRDNCISGRSTGINSTTGGTVTINNNNITGNGGQGISSFSTGNITADNNFLSQNNGAAGADLSTNSPSSNSTPQQYFGFGTTTMTNPRSTALTCP